MPLTNQIKEFVEWKGTHSPKAVEPYGLWVRRFDAYTNKSLEQVDVEDIVAFSQYVQATYSPTTHYYAMTILHTFFSFWNKRTKCLPADLIVTKRVKANSHNAVSETEYHAILKTFSTTDFQGLRNTCIVRLLGECGMRVSELTDLLVQDINLRDRCAVIRTKKTRKERRIVWSEETNALLISYIEQRLKVSKSPYLFVGFFTDGMPSQQISSRSVQRIMKKGCKDAGIERRLSPHGLRHHFAVKRRRNGASIAFVQKALGHSSPTTTIDTYEQYGIDEFVDEARRYVDNDLEPKYTPPIRKLEQEEERRFAPLKELINKSTPA